MKRSQWQSVSSTLNLLRKRRILFHILNFDMLFLTTVTILAVIAMPATQAHSLQDLTHQEWEAFKTTFGKKYSNNSEETLRMEIYLENRRKIDVHNKNAGNTYTLRMNHFGDLLPHEFTNIQNGFKMSRNRTLFREGSVTFTPADRANVSVSESVDWGAYLTGVKNQGQCGSGWAFSAAGSLEGQIARETGQKVSLSAQNLIDCSSNFGNNGCGGGPPDYAFAYIKSNEGIDTEVHYPYEARDGPCRYKPEYAGGYVTGYVDVKEGDEEMLKIAVATIGPISVVIDTSQESFRYYSSGIYSDGQCSQTMLNHAVLVVGYGGENGKEYWLVKNSWGSGWGEQGYIRIARNQNNMCGIATRASYPVF